MTRYYGFNWTYGIGKYNEATLQPVGGIKVFNNAKERDNWVANDDLSDGHAHREAVTAKFAVKVMRHTVAREDYKLIEQAKLDGYKPLSAARELSTENLLKHYSECAF